MARYRKKPVVVEAWHWAAGNQEDTPQWIDDAIDKEVIVLPPLNSNGFLINTLEGPVVASPGDWIIRGVKGELYPCKPDIFEATYEPVEGQEE
jgi:hypothetical protein